MKHAPSRDKAALTSVRYGSRRSFLASRTDPGRPGGERGRARDREGRELLLCDNGVDQAGLAGALGVDGLAEQEPLAGARRTDNAGQEHARRPLGAQPEADERHLQPRVSRHDDVVGVQEQRRADADGSAVDRHDDGLVLVDELQQKPEDRARLACRRVGHEVAEVVAGRERPARPLEQDHAHGRVGIGTGELAGERRVHGVREGVLLLGASDREDADGPLGAGQDGIRSASGDDTMRRQAVRAPGLPAVDGAASTAGPRACARGDLGLKLEQPDEGGPRGIQLSDLSLVPPPHP